MFRQRPHDRDARNRCAGRLCGSSQEAADVVSARRNRKRNDGSERAKRAPTDPNQSRAGRARSTRGANHTDGMSNTTTRGFVYKPRRQHRNAGRLSNNERTPHGQGNKKTGCTRLNSHRTDQDAPAIVTSHRRVRVRRNDRRLPGCRDSQRRLRLAGGAAREKATCENADRCYTENGSRRRLSRHMLMVHGGAGHA